MSRVSTQAGQLRHQVILRRDATSTSNTFNETVKTGNDDLGTVWASINSLQGREFENSSITVSELTHIIMIRFIDGLTTNHRVIFDSRIFEIVSIKNIEEREALLRLECKEKTGDA